MATELKFTDGSVFVYKLDKPYLKDGSVPTKFHNCPTYLSSKTPKRKAPAPRSQEDRMQTNQQDSDLDHVNDDGAGRISLESLCAAEKPNKCWTITRSDDNYIICIKFDDNFQCERYVIVNQDHSVKVNILCFM